MAAWAARWIGLPDGLPSARVERIPPVHEELHANWRMLLLASQVQEYFGSIPATMLSLWAAISGGNEPW